MKILYLSKNMRKYKSAMYQQEVMDELEKKIDVVFYGPGFEGFDAEKEICSVFNFENKEFDFLVVGHSWLEDNPEKNVDRYPGLKIDKCPIQKAVFLNKEYTNLGDKLNWIRGIGFCQGFSHHHDVEYYSEETNIPFLFLPFACDDKKFVAAEGFDKDIDFAFSGIIQNLSKNSNQSDARARVMNKIFHCVGDIPIIKRKKYANLNVFWNSIPRSKIQQTLSTRLGIYKYLSGSEYADMQLRSKVYLNTLSPANLISPRFFENMASKTLVFCEKSEHVERIFPKNCFVTFEPDLSDFEEKLIYYLNHFDAREDIVRRASQLVSENHTWEKRAQKIINTLSKVALD